MAVTAIPKSTNFVLEVQKGTDDNGNPVFSTKTFSGVKDNADNENILDVAYAIADVLDSQTGNCFLNKKSSLMRA